MKKIFVLFVLIVVSVIIFNPKNIHAFIDQSNDSTLQSEEKIPEVINNYYKATILEINKKIDPETGQVGKVHHLLANIDSTDKKGEQIKISWIPVNDSDDIFKLKTNDKVILQETVVDGASNWSVVDKDRTSIFIYLFILLAILLILVSRVQGLKAIISLVATSLVIFLILIPLIIKGYDPFWTTLVAIMIFIIPTLIFSHGANKKTYIAIAGIIFSILMVGVLSKITIDVAQLTGINEEETFYINLFGNKINLVSLLFAGIILGAVGVMDDLTIIQSSLVYELSKSNKLSVKKLFTKAMRVGNDHIAATINTLLLAYTAVSLPLIIFIAKQEKSFFYLINREVIATEIIRILIGTIGIVLTIPITTFIASIVFGKKEK